MFYWWAVEVPDSSSGDSHHVIQFGIGWADGLLHQFTGGGGYCGLADVEQGADLEDDDRSLPQPDLHGKGSASGRLRL
jgi:hypothetical protein